MRPLEKGDQLTVKPSSTQLNPVLPNSKSNPILCRAESEKPTEGNSALKGTATKALSNSKDKYLSKKSKNSKRKKKYVTLDEIVSTMTEYKTKKCLATQTETETEAEAKIVEMIKEIYQITKRPRFELEWNWANDVQKTVAKEVLGWMEEDAKFDDLNHDYSLMYNEINKAFNA